MRVALSRPSWLKIMRLAPRLSQIDNASIWNARGVARLPRAIVAISVGTLCAAVVVG